MKLCFKRNLGLVSLVVVASLLCSSQTYAMDEGDKERVTLPKALALAEQGNSKAQTNLGCIYKSNKQYAQAFLYCKRAADAGCPRANYNLACMYHYGEGVPQDYKKALSYYESAADKANLGSTPDKSS